jgi:N-methylhydantoinase A/oxoprolinase/acetone carboxylase beta subunit
VVRAGLTPTDVLHAEGIYTSWDAEAARLSIAATAHQVGMSETELTAAVRGEVDRLLARAVLGKLTAERTPPPEGALDWLLRRIAQDGRRQGGLSVHLSAGLPIVGIGTPAGAYLPRVARMVGVEAIIPEHAEVANAVGAAVGGVAESVSVVVKAVYSAAGIVGYTVHSAAGRSEFRGVEAAVDHAAQTVRSLALKRALEAGATEVDVHVERTDLKGTADPAYGSQVFLETRLRATAVGRVAQ